MAAVPEVITEAELPEGVRGLAPEEAIETKKEMGTLADYTDDKSFRAFLGEHTKYWSEATYNKAKAGRSFKIYRAVPTSITEIHLGAWVTQSREYAQSHLDAVLRGEGHIIEGVAKANELVAMSESEFFYVPEVTPPAVKAEVLPMSAVEYDRRYTLEKLREMAKQGGLSPSGSKKEIAARLIARGIK